MRRVCTICARGGSKGVAGKNVRELMGKPLIVHAIDQARQSRLFHAIAVSSDAPAILEIAQRCGVDVVVRRPDEMATDSAPKVPAIVNCVQEAEAKLGIAFPTIVDLDATSPLRDISDIIGVVQLLEESGVSNVITGALAHRSPYFNLVELDEGGVARLSKPPGFAVVRRQDAPRCFDMNASVYAWRRDALLSDPRIFYNDTALFEMPVARSFDIDSELDWDIVAMLMNRVPRGETS